MPKAKIKPHRTVTLTVEMIDRFRPCLAGLENVLPFLPAKISTDPEQNIELALEFVETVRATTFWADTCWLTERIGVGLLWPDDCSFHSEAGNPSGDPGVVAQHLAAIADKLATDAGR